MAATMLAQQPSVARAARAAPVRTRRAAVAVRASAETPETKPEATVYYTTKSGQRVTGSMQQARLVARPRLRTPQPHASRRIARSKTSLWCDISTAARCACPRGRAESRAPWAAALRACH